MFPLWVPALILALVLAALVSLVAVAVQLLRLLHWALRADERTPQTRPRLAGPLLALAFSGLAVVDMPLFGPLEMLSEFLPISRYWRAQDEYSVALLVLTVLSWIYGNRAMDWAWRRIRGRRADGVAG
ncbi:hypothetical protein [Luteimonas huabeiensis]|uniref:hypothetical protein n=1 Tax=Luteimonas huabeiensis TaxID=1244513 RepID=UPI000465AA42|nr:hypothetical protein [Luteimonas huabeiensis]